MGTVVMLCVGVVMRLAGFGAAPWQLTSPHLSSPYTDFQRLAEAWRYYDLGISPSFPGSPVHHHPAFLSLLYPLKDLPFALPGLWLLLELASVLMLRRLSGPIAWGLFWLNPICVISCCALSTVSIHCFLILMFLTCVFRKNRPFAALSGAFLLIVNPTYAPVLAVWYYAHRSFRFYLDLMVISAPFLYTGGITLSHVLLQEIRPNLGISWYLITEMFSKYEYFYRVLLAVHPYVYVYPLFMMLDRHRQLTNYQASNQLYSAILVASCFLFNPSPQLPELFLFACFFSPHWRLISLSPSRFVTVTFTQLNGIWIGLITSYLMWVMWTMRLGGNANFFFFQSMLYNGMALGFIVGLLNEVSKETVSKQTTLKLRGLLEDLVTDIIR